MFDLDKAVDDWIRSQDGARCLRMRRKSRRNGDIDELRDHLLCEVERLEGEGLAVDEAFRQATARMTPPHGERTRRRHLHIANALAWAAVMIASALLMAKGNMAEDVASYLLLVVLVPAWWVTDRMIQRNAKGASGD